MAASKSQSPFQRRVATKREIRSQKEITDSILQQKRKNDIQGLVTSFYGSCIKNLER